ncbi:hypothetical protein MOUN0_N00408 [Monosporozyma unispora]|nr:hypothetical protein C6P44_003879 [Kazachstania unispora]
MVTGNSFHIYLEPDVPKSLFDLIDDADSLLNANNSDIDIALRIKLASIDPAEMLPNEDENEKKDTRDVSDASILFLVRHNDLYDEEYELEDILAGLDGGEDEKSERKVEGDDEFQEYALVHLGTKKPLTCQFGMDLTLTQETDANIQFVVRGPRGIFISGNYIIN